ncbi:sugar transferase [Streptomyces sp. NPDC002851]
MTTGSAPSPTAAAARVRPADAVEERHQGLVPAPPARGRMAAPLVVGDVVAVSVACAVAPGLERPVVVAVPLVLAQSVLHLRRGLYAPRLSCSALAEMPAVATCAALTWCAAAALVAARDPRHALSWSALALAIGGQVLLLCTARALVYRMRRWHLVRRPRPTLVVGRGTDAYQLVSLLQQQPRLGLHPVGVATSHRVPPPPSERRIPTLPLLRDRADVLRAVIQNGVQHVVMARSWGSSALVAPDLMRLFDAYGLQVWLVDTGEEDQLMSPPWALPDDLYGYPAHALRTRPGRSTAMYAKRLIDIVLGGTAIVLLSPVMALCAVAVRWADGPGVLFRQVRVGQDERTFTLLKFRTLRPVDETESDTRWNVAGDARMSKVGTFLRRSSLDELPQLWNVLRGDMSLVGPRPERPYFVRKFAQEYPGYAARHRMPTGLTGLAQINGLRGDTSIADRARFDNRYVNTWTLWQDVCVALRTVASLLRPGGG